MSKGHAEMSVIKAKLGELVETNLREEVVRMAVDMEEKLSRNDHKGGWDGMSMADLFDRLIQEERELMAAIEGGFAPNIIDECADVANFAMMIAEKARKMEKV